MARHNEIGKLGEDLAAQWIFSRGFTIIERNYSKKWGEIDIVARETDGKTHFIEVKTVSYETKAAMELAVSHQTWRPEENVDRNKQDRLKRAIQTWLSQNLEVNAWQIDILTVRLVPREKIARVKLIESVIFE